MSKLLVSACLMGQKVRYNGSDCLVENTALQTVIDAKQVVTICPEVSGGLSTPRSPAEIKGENGGEAVLQLKAKIINKDDEDVTEQFIAGAEKTLELAQKNNVKVAILKAKSPSCGSHQIYDGTHSRQLIDGMGVTAALLAEHGIHVFNENEIDVAVEMFNTLVQYKL
jgi:uncharacterized protein YbbK (DUF523 family)